jgi:serine/threonine protein kinase
MCREVKLDYVDVGEGVCYRLLRSVSCLQQLHHPHIVPLVMINLEAELNQLRLFYEDAGVALEELLKTDKLELPQAREVLRQILHALAHCHCQGITHRNLKPKYVLMRPRGAGAAPHCSAGGGTAGSAGTPRHEGHYSVKISDFNSVRWLGVPPGAADDEPLYGAAHVSGACSPTVVTQPCGGRPLPAVHWLGEVDATARRACQVPRARDPARLHDLLHRYRHLGVRLRIRRDVLGADPLRGRLGHRADLQDLRPTRHTGQLQVGRVGGGRGAAALQRRLPQHAAQGPAGAADDGGAVQEPRRYV